MRRVMLVRTSGIPQDVAEALAAAGIEADVSQHILDYQESQAADVLAKDLSTQGAVWHKSSRLVPPSPPAPTYEVVPYATPSSDDPARTAR